MHATEDREPFCEGRDDVGDGGRHLHSLRMAMWVDSSSSIAINLSSVRGNHENNPHRTSGSTSRCRTESSNAFAAALCSPRFRGPRSAPNHA